MGRAQNPDLVLSAALGADPLPDRVVVRLGAVSMAGHNQVVTTTRMVEKEEIGKCFSANETQEMAGFLQMLSDKKSKLIAYKQKARELSYAYTSDNAMLYLKEYLKE